jgi:inorganic pyrophosphatase
MTDHNFSRWRPHPWHGLEIGEDSPRIVNAYIEITPFDMIKYEIDKVSGYLRVDRPQRSSSHPPALYGFIPKTYCGGRIAKLAKSSCAPGSSAASSCSIAVKPTTRSSACSKATTCGIT